MQQRYFVYCALVITLALAIPASALAELISFGEDIDHAVPLSNDTVLCTDAGHNLFLLSVPGGEREPWPGTWDAQAAGWEEAGHIATLCVSPDGQWVCYSVGVTLSEEYPLKFEGMRYGLAVILARANGSEPKCVAMSIEVGGGPEYAFTQDSLRLVGQPFLNCPPTPIGYAAFINAEQSDTGTPEFNCIEVVTGEPAWIENLNVGDGFWKCPYSDNFRIENNWYVEHNFSSFATGGLTGSFSTQDETDCRVYGWVLPDAMLIEFENQTGLLMTTGEFRPSPYYGLQVYCWLPDGSYLLRFGDDGIVLHAEMYWDTWQIADAKLVLDYPNLEWPTLTPLPDSSGVLVNEWGPSELLLLRFG